VVLAKNMLLELLIYKKTQDFFVWIYPLLSRLPRSEKYTLGKRIEETIFEILRFIIRANYQINKMETLSELRIKLEEMQFEIRILKNLGHFSRKRYEFASRAINELKRLLLGWMKSAVKKSNCEGGEKGKKFGNYYLGMDFEDNLEQESEEHSEENLHRAIREVHEKINMVKGANKKEMERKNDYGGRWLFEE